jgi:hypothetical protein
MPLGVLFAASQGAICGRLYPSYPLAIPSELFDTALEGSNSTNVGRLPGPPRPRAPVRVVSAKPRPRVSQARWLGTLLQMARGVDDGASDIEFEAGRAFN